MHIKFKNLGTNIYQAIVIMLKNMDIILLIFFIRFIIFIIPFALLNAQTSYEKIYCLSALWLILFMRDSNTLQVSKGEDANSSMQHKALFQYDSDADKLGLFLAY